MHTNICGLYISLCVYIYTRTRLNVYASTCLLEHPFLLYLFLSGMVLTLLSFRMTIQKVASVRQGSKEMELIVVKVFVYLQPLIVSLL